ncbi:glutathione synthase [Candidatus Pseudothioglobus sp. Uisw_086]|uniref:glutathione synthase n=1 Tax=Candidatus Pseudothioglobus sp. Uisw_086 TaxID=3230998 RepID=UPI003A867E96
MKPIILAVLMDDISSIKPIKDSSFAMMLEAQKRGWDIYTFDSPDMFYGGGKVVANARKTLVKDSEHEWYKCEATEELQLTNIDVVFMRKDPPFDMDYIYATYLLEHAEDSGVLVVNKPSSLRDANEKLFALNFPNCIPETLVSSNIEKLSEFISKIKIAVVKPLDGMGGTDIFKLTKDDKNIEEVLLKITNQGSRYIMAQEFLPEIKDGDKRILLINGRPVDYALARIPAEGNFKGNLAAGAKGVGQPLSERDRYLCSQIAPMLIEKELMFVGLDVIGDYITEINVTSPTCIRELDSQFNLNISSILLDEVEVKLALR